MAGVVTITGLREARAALEQLPETVTQALKGVARATAERIKVGYQERLLAQTHGTGRTAASARVLDESNEKQFTVNVPGHPDDAANLPLWLERGTRHMRARPALRPAGDAENERYKQEMATAAEHAVRETLT